VQDSYHITFINENEYPLWDEFVSRSPQGSFFYTTKWADILKNTFNRNYKIAVCSRRAKWLAGTILFINRRLRRSLITPVPLQFFNAPIFYPPTHEKYQKTVAHILEISDSFSRFFSYNFPLWIVTTPYTISDLRAYQWHDCIVEPTYSYVLDLNPGEDPAEFYSQSVRRKIKQASQYQPQVVKNDLPGQFIKLYQKSYLRHNQSPFIEVSVLNKLFENVKRIPQFKLYYLKFGEKTVAGRLICIDNQHIYDLLAGSSDETGTASVFLVDHIIRKYAGQCISFDFMGADHEQIEQFKRGFGAKLMHGFKITGRAKFPFSLLYKLQKSALRRRRAL